MSALDHNERVTLLDAADMIERAAEELRRGEESPDGTWQDPDDKAEYGAYLRVAKRLRFIVKKQRKSPPKDGE